MFPRRAGALRAAILLGWPSPVQVKAPASRQHDRLTNTAVPKFDGTGCWQQHLQVFNAIVKLNGWVDETGGAVTGPLGLLQLSGEVGALPKEV